MGTVFNNTGKEADRLSSSDIDVFDEKRFDNVPLILSPENRRKAVFGAVRMWAEMYPAEAEQYKREVTKLYHDYNGELPRTAEGGQFIGAIP